jgi:anti-anti-sigma factor
VTALRQLEAPTGLRSGDHVYWTFADDSELSSAVLPYLDEGRRLGEQLLLTGASRSALLQAVAALPHRDEMLASGQLEVRATTELYDAQRGLDPVEQAQVYVDEARAAVGRGRTGLRVAGDSTPLARRGPEERRPLHMYEHMADALMATVPLTALCLYDASLGDDVLGPIVVLHPDQHHGRRDPLSHVSGRGLSLSLRGEVDSSQTDDLLRVLVDIAGDAPGEVVLDLGGLDFLDVSGARMLATAERLLAGTGVRLRCVRAQRLPRLCLDLFDLADGEAVSR